MDGTHSGSNAIVGALKGTSYGIAVGVTYMGLTPEQWSVVGIVSGIAIGFLTLIASQAVNIYFKHQHLKLARQELERRRRQLPPNGEPALPAEEEA